ncbi:hypothetical protein [Antarcticimicrobium sediminis]|uniref:Homeodomain-like domain-containing protein n=1 Tax=Antarcticimicrobium sediminis TaxID=2546227 RepID=A0A4R5F0Q8_9RHOB|nr:hypothetical protein [Antarcticimicrobium sediminis]TDE40953.1 hypothetical protein E1B25_01700 [Antarcticimicrobium sediminis]
MKSVTTRRETVVQLALKGNRPCEIIEQTGLSRTTIYHDLKVARRAGQHIPDFNKRGISKPELEPSERHKQVIALAVEGVPPRLIAEQLSLDSEAVYYELRNARRRGTQIPRFRCGRRPNEFRMLRLEPEAMRPLATHALARGMPTARLAERLLERIAADDLVDAVLDDGGADG